MGWPVVCGVDPKHEEGKRMKKFMAYAVIVVCYLAVFWAIPLFVPLYGVPRIVGVGIMHGIAVAGCLYYAIIHWVVKTLCNLE